MLYLLHKRYDRENNNKPHLRYSRCFEVCTKGNFRTNIFDLGNVSVVKCVQIEIYYFSIMISIWIPFRVEFPDSDPDQGRGPDPYRNYRVVALPKIYFFEYFKLKYCKKAIGIVRVVMILTFFFEQKEE